MSHRWLILDLCAPLMSFGGVSIDHVGAVRDFPAASMLTGLFANALGWHWADWQAHQALQDRMVFASAILREGEVITDSQNARLEKTDKGWTTFGQPEGRDGDSYDAPHRRRRDYVADAQLRIVLRPTVGNGPDIDELAAALQRPARPLFIGRKPCLPSGPLMAGWCEAGTAHQALCRIGVALGARAEWPADQGPDGYNRLDLPDLRNWRTGLHGGSRVVIQGRLSDREAAT